MDKVIQQRSEKSGIGFSADVVGETDKAQVGEILEGVEPEDLIKYGLIPEFVGRLPVVATLNELNIDALVEILTEPKNSLTKQYKALFEMEGVQIIFRDDGLRAVARKAVERKTGARGLRSILEDVLLDTMYEIPSSKQGLKQIIVDESVVDRKTPPIKVYDGESDKEAI